MEINGHATFLASAFLFCLWKIQPKYSITLDTHNVESFLALFSLQSSLSCQYRRQVIKIRRLRGFQLLRCYHPLFIILVCVLNCHIANNAQASLHSKPSMMKAQTNEFHDCLARPFRMKFCRENQNKKAAHKIVQYKSMFELPCQTLAFRRCNDCYVNNCQPTSFSKKVSFNI